MKILAVMGSPHAGNTLELTQRFEQKLKALGDDVEFEYIHLKDVNIKPCRGCFVCFVWGEEKCPIKDDDKKEIEEKLLSADGVVFVSPVYSMHVSYLFKQFLDRFAYNGHRPRYFDKYAIVLAATGGLGLKETLAYMKSWLSAWGFNVVDSLGYIAPPKKTPYRALIDMKDRTDEVARKFYSAIKEKKPPRPSFMDYFGFEMIRTYYARLETMSPTDYAYAKTQGWLESSCRYYTDDVDVSLIKSTVARLVTWPIGRSVDKKLAKVDS